MQDPVTSPRASGRPADPATGNLLSGAPDCGAVFDVQNEASRRLVQAFLQCAPAYGLNPVVIGVDKKKGGDAALSIPYTRITRDDVNLFGGLKNKRPAKDFALRPFALLVDLSLSPCRIADKILRASRARFKVGVDKSSDLFDFRFTLPEEAQATPEVFDELLSCLGKIDLPRP